MALHPTFVKDELSEEPASPAPVRGPTQPGDQVVGRRQPGVGLRVRARVAVVVRAAGLDQAQELRAR